MNIIDSFFEEGNLYNHLFGMNPHIKEILKLYGFNLDFDKYRVRDCYFTDNKFVILTRIGNPRYKAVQDDIKSHELYLSNDIFDDSYMSFYFKLIKDIPEEYKNYDNRHVKTKFETIDYSEYVKSDKFKNTEHRFKKLFGGEWIVYASLRYLVSSIKKSNAELRPGHLVATGMILKSVKLF